MPKEKKKQRRRRDKRSPNPKPLAALTDRHRMLLQDIYNHRVLSGSQIQRLHFPTRYIAQDRLERLYDHGYVERKFLPIDTGAGGVYLGSSPTLYILDKKGADELGVKWHSKSVKVKPEYLQHTLEVSEFAVRVNLACRQLGFELPRWDAEAKLKSKPDKVTIQISAGTKRTVSLIPDSYFEIVANGHKYHFFLEVDRGTMTVKRFKNKIRAYQEYFKTGAYGGRYKTQSLRVLTVVGERVGKERLANLKKATEDVAKKEDWFLFASLSKLTPANILTRNIWEVSNSQPTSLIAD